MDLAGPLEANRASVRRPSHTTIACPNCGIYQPVEVDYDGDHGCAILPVTPCSVCHRDLCGFCDQAQCECGQIVCLQCTLTVPDGTPSGLTLCKPCAHSSDPLCPACGEFAPMLPRQNSQQQWFECSGCGAAMEGDEIDTIQPVAPLRRQPGIAPEQGRGGTFPEVA